MQVRKRRQHYSSIQLIQHVAFDPKRHWPGREGGKRGSTNMVEKSLIDTTIWGALQHMDAIAFLTSIPMTLPLLTLPQNLLELTRHVRASGPFHLLCPFLECSSVWLVAFKSLVTCVPSHLLILTYVHTQCPTLALSLFPAFSFSTALTNHRIYIYCTYFFVYSLPPPKHTPIECQPQGGTEFVM